MSKVTCKAGETVTGTVIIPESTMPTEGIRLAVSAANGSVSLSADGTFTYTPYEGFTGEDWFEVVADYGSEEARDIRGMTQRCIRDLERIIRRHPSAWVLNYRYFRKWPEPGTEVGSAAGR